jgi:hypothetical protein
MLHYAIDSSFHSFGKLMFVPEETHFTIKPNETFVLRARAVIPKLYSGLDSNMLNAYPIKIGVFDKQKWLKDIDVATTLGNLSSNNLTEIPIQLDFSRALTSCALQYSPMQVGTHTIAIRSKLK